MDCSVKSMYNQQTSPPSVENSERCGISCKALGILLGLYLSRLLFLRLLDQAVASTASGNPLTPLAEDTQKQTLAALDAQLQKKRVACEWGIHDGEHHCVNEPDSLTSER
jgi:hypothetical protein